MKRASEKGFPVELIIIVCKLLPSAESTVVYYKGSICFGRQSSSVDLSVPQASRQGVRPGIPKIQNEKYLNERLNKVK